MPVFVGDYFVHCLGQTCSSKWIRNSKINLNQIIALRAKELKLDKTVKIYYICYSMLLKINSKNEHKWEFNIV